MKAGSPVVLGGLHISWLKRQNEGSKESGEQGAKVQGGHRAPRVPGVEWWKRTLGFQVTSLLPGRAQPGNWAHRPAPSRQRKWRDLYIRPRLAELGADRQG